MAIVLIFPISTTGFQTCSVGKTQLVGGRFTAIAGRI
jgi:hypothetical protein